MPSWDEITEAELRRLFFDERMSDAEIAHFYDITKYKVSSKREKLGVTKLNQKMKELREKRGEFYDRENAKSKKKLLDKNNIDQLSKAISHYVFRNGPIEDMHANHQLSEEDMKALNKFMVNRIAGLLTAVADNSWVQLDALLLKLYQYYGADWEPVVPDMYEIEKTLEL